MQHFIEGFSVIFQMQYLLYMFGGVGIGLILGCLPGLTGSMGIALMLPFTYKMPPLTALVFLLSIYTPVAFHCIEPVVLIHMLPHLSEKRTGHFCHHIAAFRITC